MYTPIYQREKAIRTSKAISYFTYVSGARKKRKFMTWLEFIHALVGYRYFLLPLYIILIQFTLQALNSLIEGVYGRHILQLHMSMGSLRIDYFAIMMLGLNLSPLGVLVLIWILKFVAKNSKLYQALEFGNDKSMLVKFACIAALFGIFWRLLIPFASHSGYKKPLFSGFSCAGLILFWVIACVDKGFSASKRADDESLGIGISVSTGILFIIFWKTLGSTIDISMDSPLAQLFIWIHALVAIVYLGFIYAAWYWKDQHSTEKDSNKDIAKDLYMRGFVEKVEEDWAPWRIQLLCIGILGNLMMLYISFGSPAVMARWVRGNYSASVIFQCIALLAYSAVMCFKPKTVGFLRTGTIRLLNIILGGLLSVLAYRSQFINYNYLGGVQQGLVYACVFFSPVLVLNIQLMWHELLRSDIQVKLRHICQGFVIGAILTTALMTFSTFSVIYPYIGPKVATTLFKNNHDVTYWLFFLFAALPVLLIRTKSLIYFNDGVDDIVHGDGRYGTKLKISAFLYPAVSVLMIFTVLIWTTPTKYYVKTPPKVKGNTIGVGIVNVNSGYDKRGLLNFRGYSENIQEMEMDILGLIESDTCRIANGNNDFVRYIANSKGMYSYYGPKPTEGTMGISLLSKFPILRKRTKTVIVSGSFEKTAIISSELKIRRKKSLTVIITQFGFTPGHFDYHKVVLLDIIKEIPKQQDLVLLAEIAYSPKSKEMHSLREAIKEMRPISIIDSWDHYEKDANLHPTPGRILSQEIYSYVFVSGNRLSPKKVSLHETVGHRPALITNLVASWFRPPKDIAMVT